MSPMPRILLINPPFEQEEESVGRSKSVRKVLNIVPPLGITYVAAILERAGIETNIINRHRLRVAGFLML